LLYPLLFLAAVAFGVWLFVEMVRSARVAGDAATCDGYLGGCVCCWLARALRGTRAEDRQRLARRTSAELDGVSMARMDQPAGAPPSGALSGTRGELGTYPAVFVVPGRG